jgi:hypothetical protein
MNAKDRPHITWIVLFIVIAFILGCGFGLAAKGSFLNGVHNWQTLISVVVGSLVALTVAAIARQGVHRQIEAQRKNASRADDEAYAAIRDGAKELYGMLNLLWRVVDVALAPEWKELRDANFNLVKALARSLPDEKNLEALVEIAAQMSPRRRRKFLLFINMVRSLYRELAIEEVKVFDDGEDKAGRQKWLLLGLRTYLTHAHVYLEAYDSDSASLFKRRKKATVDHRDMHEHFEGWVSNAEIGKNWLE